jgi:hypothetical protein
MAYTTDDIDWLYGKADWEKLACIGAVNTQFNGKKGASKIDSRDQSLFLLDNQPPKSVK